MRPSLAKPTLTRAVQRRARAPDVVLLFAGDAHHDRRVRPSSTAAPGSPSRSSPATLLPKPPPVYSLMRTTFVRLDADPARDRRRPSARCSACRAVHDTACRSASRPSPCASRAAGGWCSWPTNVSSSTSAAFLKPASRSPYDHSSVRLAHRQLALGSDSAKSSSVHFSSLHRATGAARRARLPSGAGGSRRTCPRRCPSLARVRAARPQAASGSTTNGSGSNSIWIFSIASAAVSSSTAATARIGSPS